MLEAELNAKTNQYQRKVEAAKAIIDKALSMGRFYVAWSCGKDSSAMLHLARSVKCDIEARFIRWTESQMLDDFERVVSWWQSQGLNLTILDLHRESLDDKVKSRWSILEALSLVDGYFIGFRAGESRGRKMTLAKDGTIYRRNDGMIRVCPLAWWSTIDVASYTLQNGIPILDAYAKDGFDQRTSARVPRESVRHMALADLRNRDIGRFNQLCAAYPEARSYV